MTGSSLTVSELLRGTPYRDYVYAYPHKTAYRPLSPTPSLRSVWESERRNALFLYLHVPFCTMRCGFCNLFTQANPSETLVPLYLDALRRQADVVRSALGPATFARFALGGGTPTYLCRKELDTVLDIAEKVMGIDFANVPASVEVSPDTASSEKLELLRGRGIERISIGIQSFIESESRASGRLQRTEEVCTALQQIRDLAFPVLNVDLIYGLPGQTVDTWMYSLREALCYRPDELYLYPLYVRPLTGLGRSSRQWDDVRVSCYRSARDYLAAAGYEQVSMRMFALPRPETISRPAYCCQTDGMIGLGCGARSYSRALHYSTEYAVGASDIRAIIANFVENEVSDFAVANHGFELDLEEQRRRHVLQSLLTSAGLHNPEYTDRFGRLPVDDFPELAHLVSSNLASMNGDSLQLTPAGLERSDAIGPYLFSDRVKSRMRGYMAR